MSKYKGKVFAVPCIVILVFVPLFNVLISEHTTSNSTNSKTSFQSNSKYENGTLDKEDLESSNLNALYTQEIPIVKQEPDMDDNIYHYHKSSESSPSPLFVKDEICSYFPSQSFTASSMWQIYLDEIFNASNNPDMPQELSIFHNTNEAEKMHDLLYHTLAPSRMRRGVLHMPTLDSTHDTVKHIIRILEHRIRDPVNNPPLKIVVFGGSVTIGRECYGRVMEHKSCAWPRRFELLINQFVGMDLIKIYNLGIGGTNTTTASHMVDYWMYPDDLKQEGPDVIINSYSTNGEEILEMYNSFISSHVFLSKSVFFIFYRFHSAMEYDQGC